MKILFIIISHKYMIKQHKIDSTNQNILYFFYIYYQYKKFCTHKE